MRYLHLYRKYGHFKVLYYAIICIIKQRFRVWLNFESMFIYNIILTSSNIVFLLFIIIYKALSQLRQVINDRQWII